MAIVGFNLTKMTAEKTGNLVGKVSINNNIAVTDAKEMDISLGKDTNKGLMLKFEYGCYYEPKIGKIMIEGELLTIEQPEKVKSCVESWKEKKTIDKEIMQSAMSYVLSKCTMQAVITSRDMNLPSPVPMPKIEVGGNVDTPAQGAEQGQKPKEKKKQ